MAVRRWCRDATVGTAVCWCVKAGPVAVGRLTLRSGESLAVFAGPQRGLDNRSNDAERRTNILTVGGVAYMLKAIGLQNNLLAVTRESLTVHLSPLHEQPVPAGIGGGGARFAGFQRSCGNASCRQLLSR